MKIKHIISIALTAAALCTLSTNADAQLGGMLNKAKSAAKQTVDNKAKEKAADTQKAAEQKATEQVEQKAEAVTEQAAASAGAQTNAQDDKPFYQRKFTPTPEALAADPEASDQTIKNGYSRSVADIHAAYEHFNLDDHPYVPYYKYPNFYCLDIDDSYLFNMFSTKIANIFTVKSTGNNLADNKIMYVDESNQNIVVPTDETYRNAWECRFIADPNIGAFVYYLHSLTMIEPRGFKADFIYNYENLNEGIVNSKEGLMLPANFFKMRREREDVAYYMATTALPYDALVNYAKSVVAQIEKVKDVKYKLLFLIEGNILLQGVIPDHKDYADNKGSDDLRLIKMGLAKYKYGDMLQLYSAENSEPVDEPSGVAVAADIKSRGTEAAKSYAGDAFEKIIFLRATWETFKEQEYPYRTMSYGMPVAVVTNENGHRLIQDCNLQKSPDGSRWFVSAGSNASKRPLK